MANNSQQKNIDIPTNTQEIARVLLVGISVGALTLVLGYLIAEFFIQPVFCRSEDTAAICSGKNTVAFNVSMVLVSMLAVATLVRLKVYRPLLVALGPVVSLWSLSAYIGGLSTLEYIFWTVALFGLAYVLFHWLMRIRNFVAALSVLIVSMILIRLIFIL